LVDPALDENAFIENDKGVGFPNWHRSQIAGANGDYVTFFFMRYWVPVWKPVTICLKVRPHNDLMVIFSLIEWSKQLGYQFSGMAHNDIDNKLEFFFFLSLVRRESVYSVSRCLIQGVHTWFTAGTFLTHWGPEKYLSWLSAFALKGFLTNYGQVTSIRSNTRDVNQPFTTYVTMTMKKDIPRVQHRDSAFRD